MSEQAKEQESGSQSVPECECGAGPDGCMCGFAETFNASEKHKRDLIDRLTAENEHLRNRLHGKTS